MSAELNNLQYYCSMHWGLIRECRF